MSGRDYGGGRSSRPPPREPYDEFEPISRQRSQPAVFYDNPSQYSRGSRDGLSRMSTRSEYGTSIRAPDPTTARKTKYRVDCDRESDVHVTKGNVIVLDSRLDRDRELSDWEVIRPERSESGAYVIETSSTSDYASPGRRRDLDYDDRSRLAERRDIDILSPPRRQDRSMSRGTREAMHEVRVTEDDSFDDGRGSTRSRRTLRGAETDMAVVAPPLVRHVSSMRHDHSPDSVTKRRSRSIGFIRGQISHHDASESKHERPGAEANVAGKYLINHRGERTRRRDDEDDSAFEPYPLRKHKTETTDTYGVEVERRRREGRQKEVDYRYERDDYVDRREPYPPQKDRRRYRRDDDDDSRYSEYYDKRTSKRSY